MFFFKLKSWWQFSIISLLSLVIYLPIIGNSFVNDDFIVIKKVCIDGRLNTDGFFRPLSDISIWLTYLLGGLRPWPFYLTGILVHALSTLLLIKLCLRWQWTSNERSRHWFALLAGALFLTYPFHNESVAWILGRGALMANTLGIAALLILVSPGKDLFKKIAVCLCYFIGLGFYETIIVLPGMVFLYLVINRTGVRQTGQWVAALTITLLLHIILRIRVSGSMAGDYGANFFSINWTNYLTSFPKALGRAFLPPMQNSGLLVALSLGVLAIIITVIFYVHRRLKGDKQAIRFFITLVAFFLLAMLVPAVAGVSTRTSESDRFLHFPSYFLAMLMAFVLIVLLRATRWFLVVPGMLLCTQIILLEINNRNWHKASSAVRDILDMVKKNTAERPLYIIALPEEINGAFVFRAGFGEALSINNINPAQVRVLHHYSREEPFISETENEVMFQPSIKKTDNDTLILNYKAGGIIQEASVPSNSKIIYWSKGRWIDIQ